MKIFLSHSSHDKWAARQIARQLEELGCHTFLDEKHIKTGDSIDHAIQEHLKDCDDLLILLSPASLKSHWVFIELGSAKALGKRIVPILFHLEPNEVPHPIATVLARDINEIERYFDEVRSCISGKKLPTVPQLTQPTKGKKTARKAPSTSRGKHRTPDGFAIGDKIKIVDVALLTEADKNRNPGWVDEMNVYSGTESMVTRIPFDDPDAPRDVVNLAVDDEEFWWATRWLRKIG